MSQFTRIDVIIIHRLLVVPQIVLEAPIHQIVVGVCPVARSIVVVDGPHRTIIVDDEVVCDRVDLHGQISSFSVEHLLHIWNTIPSVDWTVIVSFYGGTSPLL